MSLRRLFVITTAAAVLLALIGCGGGNEDATASVGPVTAGCTKSEVNDRVQVFAAALRDADLAQLRAIWAEPRFKWFSAGRREGGKEKWNFVAFKRSKALRWVQRHDGLPIRVTEVQGGSREPKTRGHVGFNYEGRWRGERFVGKGDMLCKTPEIRVWSMAIGVNPT